MIILDTNVISELMRKAPDPAVVRWLDEQPATSVWTTAVTIYEIEFGLKRLRKGKRRDRLEDLFHEVITRDLGGRVLDFDRPAAAASAALSAEGQANGRPIDIRDVLIAGIASARRATVATRNIKDFRAECAVVNPWDES